MANHYYSENPETAHDLKQWFFTLLGKEFSFVTDSGVFSRETVDFGSRLLIETFSDRDLPAGTLLDVGCGYGPVGLALAYATDRPVEMIDVNNRAVELAQQNAEKNQLEADIHQSNIYADLHLQEYAAILSNPPIRAGKKVVHEILEKAAPLLKTDGSLNIVIQKKQGAPSAQKKMAEVFGNVEVIAKDKGYYILRSVKE